MSKDDPETMKSTMRGMSVSYSTTTDENSTVEDRLFEIAARCHMPLRRMDGESLHSAADRLTLDIERDIALHLLYLGEIHQLDLDEHEEDAS